VTDTAERERLLRALRTMATYAGSESVCRRKQLLAYFGEDYTEDRCGACDVCAATDDRADCTVDAQKVLSAMARTGARFGASHIAAIVGGAQTARIRELGHDKLPTYGVGKDRDRQYWRKVIDEMLTTRLVVQSDGQYPVLGFGEGAQEVLRGERAFMVRRTARPAPRVKEALPTGGLFDRLREVRSDLARKRRVPAYIIFSDRTLRDIAEKMPRNEGEMLCIHGVGEAKLHSYGGAFLAALHALNASAT
jgi:ATP-dependent DNA helicase RecQ